MERIKLTKAEKRVLINIALQSDYLPHGYSQELYSACVALLEKKGLVRASWEEGHNIVDVHITDYAISYIEQNPKLSNPVDWKWIVTIIITSLTAVASVIALFVACNNIKL